MKKFAVIVAGGSGSRMNSAVPKQFLQLKGKPVLLYTLNAFLDAYDDCRIILVLPADHLEHGLAIAQATGQAQRIQVTEGGDTRYQSVANGLSLVDDDSIVFVHDAVRCLVSTALIHRCYESAVRLGNAIPAVAATDSIRIKTDQGARQVDRNNVFLIQTPQTFHASKLKKAFSKPYQESFTDEANVAEASGATIHVVEGEATNIKLTRPADLLIAEQILNGNI